jgi:hypothetical protein
VRTSCGEGHTGSKRINRLAPIKLIPHPPALELRRNTNSLPSGSLNLDTIFDRLLTFIVPSNRTQPYLGMSYFKVSKPYFFVRHSFSMRSNVWVALLIKTILSVVKRLIWSSILHHQRLLFSSTEIRLTARERQICPSTSS